MQDAALNMVRPLFATLPGVSAPPPFGCSARTILVNVKPDRMRAYNLSPDEIVNALSQANIVSPSGNMKVVSESMAQGRGTVGKLIMEDTLYNAAFATVTNLHYATSDIKALTTQADGMITQVRGLIDYINSGRGTLGKLYKEETLYNETTTAMTNLREILEKMNKGQGTVGKLINDDSFLKNAKLSLQKLDKATDGLEDQGPLSVLGLIIGSLF